MEYAYIISCETGCSCCSGENNHYRGFYKTKEDAETRIKWFMDPNAVNNPIGSQYARKGRYYIRTVSLEPISNERWIVDGDKVFSAIHFVTELNKPDDNETIDL